MKICVISPGVVHAVPRTVAIANQFEEIHFIDMKGNSDKGALEEHGIKYHLPCEGGESRISSLNLQRLFNLLKPDAIVCHYGSGDHFFNAIAYGRCPVAVIAMGHDVLYERGNLHISLLRRLLIRMGLRRASYICAKSNYLVERIKSYAPDGNIDINYWGADFNSFKPKDTYKARRSLNLPENVPIILSPRAIDPTYNILKIIEAFFEIKSTYNDAILVILGRSQEKYLIEIIEIINDSIFSKDIYLIGEVGQDVLSNYYNASDVVVSMANSEGFPNTILEVMSCEIPIVVGKIPQIDELLKNGQNATVCEITTLEIKNSILKVLNNPKLSKGMLTQARNTVQHYADIMKNGRLFADRLCEISNTHISNSTFETLLFRIVYIGYLAQKIIFKKD